MNKTCILELMCDFLVLFYNVVLMQASEKNIRISAMEENEVKIFLISCSPKDADKLFTALEYR